jgi:lysophospholipase L1-like esterase
MRGKGIAILVGALFTAAAGSQVAAGGHASARHDPGPPLTALQEAGEEPAPKPDERRVYVVAAMGDSLTDPKSHGGKYLEYLREKCPESRFDSYGKGGNMVNQMRARFARDIYGEMDDGEKEERPAYTHVVILGGINDICSDESADRTNDKIKDDLSAMYRMAAEHGSEVIAVTLPPWGGFKKYYNARRAASTREINRWIKKQHAEGQVAALFDVYPIMSCGNPEKLCKRYGWKDRVHWNVAGHQVAGKALHEQLFADCK